MEIQTSFVRKGLASLQNYFFAIISTFIASLKKLLFLISSFTLIQYCLAKVFSHEKSMITAYLFVIFTFELTFISRARYGKNDSGIPK